MLKDKKNIGIIILIVVVITALIILISKIILRDRYTQQAKSNILSNQVSNGELEQKEENESLQTNDELSNHEIKESLDKLNKLMKDKTDKCQVIVNGEEISEREIAYIEVTINNAMFNGNQEKSDAVNEAIKEYVIVQDAKVRNIILTDEEEKGIEKIAKELFSEDKEGMGEMLNSFQMSYDEFLTFHTDKMKRLELGTKWTLYIKAAIKNGELHTENEEFNEKCKTYNKEGAEKNKLLPELIDEYKEYLKDKAIIEYKK